MTGRRARGMTLLELTIAMAIASVLAIGLAVLATGTLDATERGDRLIESVQTARHLADRIDRLLATADPTDVAWNEALAWSPWIEAGPTGGPRARLDWVVAWHGRVVETRGGVSETLTGLGAPGEGEVGASVAQLVFKPITRVEGTTRYVVRVEVYLIVEPRDARGASGRIEWRWHAPVWAGEERFR